MGADQVEQDIRGIAEHIAAMGLDFNRLAFRKPAIERKGRLAPIDHGNLGFNASLSKYPQHDSPVAGFFRHSLEASCRANGALNSRGSSITIHSLRKSPQNNPFVLEVIKLAYR